MPAPLILLGPPSFLPISLHQAASLIPRLTVYKERSDSDTTLQATVECLCTPSAEELWAVGKDEITFMKEHEGISQAEKKTELTT